MRTGFTRKTLYVPAFLAGLFFCGCMSSPASRFYLLRQNGSNISRKESAPLIVVGPIEIAEYLNRPQIVVRKSGNEIVQAQFDRWAEPLNDQISLFLTDSLAEHLKDFTVEPFPWRGAQDPVYDISVTIIRLDGTPDVGVELVADWKIIRSGTKGHIARNERTSLSSGSPAPGMPGMVAGIEKLLTELSGAIAAAVTEVHR